MAPIGLSVLLHGAALVAALLWFTVGGDAEPSPTVLQAAAVEFHAAESCEDECEQELICEELPVETPLELPVEPLPPEAPPESCELPECEFPAFEPGPLTPTVDIPLDALSQRPPAPQPHPVVDPRPVVEPRPRPERPTQPVARPARPVRAAPARASKGRPLKLVHRPRVINYYPAEARRRGIEGEALVEIQVSARGVVTDARLVRSSGSALLDRQALRLLYDYRFAPGDGGKARVPVRFRLR